MKKYPFNRDLKALSAVFKSGGHRLYLVGGAIRDFLLDIENDDWDFTTDATPEEMQKLFKGKTIPTGIKHGTLTIRFRGKSYEVTTFRTEAGYSDKRHPDEVKFVKDLAEDLKRRDFTINAFASEVESGEIIDLSNGLEDLKAGRIRAIGDPEERFEEDALRMLRACRFASRLNFDIEENTFKAICSHADEIELVSKERVRDELNKILSSAHPAKGLTLMKESSLLVKIIPEFVPSFDCVQGEMHGGKTVWEHTLLTVEAAASAHTEESVRLAALFHDIGKSETKDGDTYYSHEIVGSKRTSEIMSRLKYSNEEKDLVSLLVRHHMFNYNSSWSDAAVRRLILKVGKENIWLLLKLRYADAAAISGSATAAAYLEELSGRIEKELEEENALSIKDLKLNGNDLIRLGVPKGPEVGHMLSYLFSQVLEAPELNEKTKLESLVIHLLSQMKS